MLGKDIFVLYSTYIILVQANTDYEAHDNNGWIPISNEQVYNQVRREFTQKPGYFTTDHTSDDDFSLKEDAIKVITSQPDGPRRKYYSYPIISKHEQILKYENDIECKLGYPICPELEIEENTETKEQNFISPIDTNRPEQKARRAKEISNRNLNKYFNLAFEQTMPHDNDKYKEKNVIKETLSDENDKSTYEVTEDLTPLDSIAGKPSEANDNIHYSFVYPKVNINSNNLNMTGALLNILTKYNINTNDKLPNYVLSRLSKNHNPLKSPNFHQPNLFKIPFRYNSPNHLPVDPLLAVFLSNYGYYLPDNYGIKNNYNNLYGYLASNNIHNNMPFGLYKIFSDTDSSH